MAQTHTTSLHLVPADQTSSLGLTARHSVIFTPGKSSVLTHMCLLLGKVGKTGILIFSPTQSERQVKSTTSSWVSQVTAVLATYRNCILKAEFHTHAYTIPTNNMIKAKAFFIFKSIMKPATKI